MCQGYKLNLNGVELSRIKFWEDTWCGEGSLCEFFPSLFPLAGSKGALVADVWDTTRGTRLRIQDLYDLLMIGKWMQS